MKKKNNVWEVFFPSFKCLKTDETFRVSVRKEAEPILHLVCEECGREVKVRLDSIKYDGVIPNTLHCIENAAVLHNYLFNDIKKPLFDEICATWKALNGKKIRKIKNKNYTLLEVPYEVLGQVGNTIQIRRYFDGENKPTVSTINIFYKEPGRSVDLTGDEKAIIDQIKAMDLTEEEKKETIYWLRKKGATKLDVIKWHVEKYWDYTDRNDYKLFK